MTSINWSLFWSETAKIWDLFDEKAILDQVRLPFGQSKISIYWNPNAWEWGQILEPTKFRFQTGVTPLSDLRVKIRFNIDYSGNLGHLRNYHHSLTIYNGVPETNETGLVQCSS